MPIQTEINKRQYNKILAFESFEMELKNIIDGNQLKAELEKVHHMAWHGFDNSDLFETPLAHISSFQIYLIKRIKKILLDERSQLNQTYVRSNLKLNEMICETEEGMSGDGILLFHEPATHYIFGDLHSDDESLKDGLVKSDFYNKVVNDEPVKLIFLGDYVDRGNRHLKTLEYLLMLKVLFPSYVFLLRGNHDGGILKPDGDIILPYGLPPTDDPMLYFPLYLKALIERNGSCDPNLLSDYLSCFDLLPYIAFIKKDNNFFQCVHGGIPRPIENGFSHLKTLSDITQYHNEHDNILQNIMWSDPYKGEGDLKTGMKRFYFTFETFRKYCEHIGVSILFRGHEVVRDGVLAHFDETLFTIFSSGSTLSSYYKNVTPKIVKIDLEGNYYFL